MSLSDGEGFGRCTGCNKACAGALGKHLADAQDDTGPEPGAARERVESPAVTSLSPFSGGDCQSPASAIAQSLMLIAIANPRDPEDAKASSSALLKRDFCLQTCNRERERKREREREGKFPENCIKGDYGSALTSHY